MCNQDTLFIHERRHANERMITQDSLKNEGAGAVIMRNQDVIAPAAGL
jgi:hypothetical protein